jgi:hypothetical protein
MHQEHALRWHAVAANLVDVHENPRFTPRRTDLFPRNLPTQTKSLHYFVRALASTIQSFSITERAKYPVSFGKTDSGKVYPDELLCSIPCLGSSYRTDALNSQNQYIEYWIKQAPNDNQGAGARYTTSHGDLADATKELLAANQMSALLKLAQHPLIPLGSLKSLSWGHSFGFDHVASTALVAYIFFNVLEAIPSTSNWQEIQSYKKALHILTCSGDHDVHALPHRMFFHNNENIWKGEPYDVYPNADLSALKEYLKLCFTMLYRYDMLLRECGLDPMWEREIVFTLNRLWDFKLDDIEKEEA